MFNKIEQNMLMLEGAYRKLKSYYYYNKNFLVMREKIAEFESDSLNMHTTFIKLSNALCHPVKESAYLDELINSIDFYVIPKKFDAGSTSTSNIISNTISRDKKMKSVNFFINAPIELHILDTLWTVFLAKMDYDKNLLSYNIYGNTINKSVLFSESSINFSSRVLFNRYFNKYSDWRNNAFQALEKLYNAKKDSVLISLDIKSYFYSVSFSFSELGNYFEKHELLKSVRRLTSIIERMYANYYSLISSFRRDIGWMKKKHYPLPIGLLSSMVLGNIYLKKFDNRILSLPIIKYYGRYVDDTLIVIERTVSKGESATDIIDDVLVKQNIFIKNSSDYNFCNYNGLCVQRDKVKLLYIDHKESKAIIDIYNDTIKIKPSQMDPLPDDKISLSNFDEVAYSIENFTKEKKLRDIGLVGIDTSKVGKYFSTLPRKYSQIDINSIKTETESHIKQIEKFFTGSQSIEFYSNWLNYMYFLVITEKNKQLHSFVSMMKKQIGELKAVSLDKNIYNKTITINKRVKEYLRMHLEICLNIALCLNFSLNKKHFNKYLKQTQKYKNANMFDHSFVTFPLANYLDYKNDVSYCKMTLNDIGEYPNKIEESFKFKWSPRFIHYDELLLLLFYHYHIKNKERNEYKYEKDGFVDRFALINHIAYSPFKIESQEIIHYEDYLLRTIDIPSHFSRIPSKVNVAVGSLNISLKKCISACKNRWSNVTLSEKELFFSILRDSYKCLSNDKNETMFLILPELCFPIYWIYDLIKFSKCSKIGIITGLQYLKDDEGRQYNYIATILPFTIGKRQYNNAFLYIREKNDYSPIEFEELAKIGFSCKNRKTAEYQTFHWNGIRLSPLVCYELTDIMARALLKGKCDFIAAPVFNPDTTYFSNIIDSTARDLHAFVIQSNTSYYGDSRVTGPYDRDSKDIFKIKGGDNDHVVIGTIDFKKFKNFQLTYNENFQKKLLSIEKERDKRKPAFPQKDKSKPNLKPLSARFKVKQ